MEGPPVIQQDISDSAQLRSKFVQRYARVARSRKVCVLQREKIDPKNMKKARSQDALHAINPEKCLNELAQSERHYAWIPAPPWMARDPLQKSFSRYGDLWIGGRVVWGRIVQANRVLFAAGSQDAPGDVLYDPSGMSNADDLRAPAKALQALKETQPADPDLRRFAEHLTNEETRALCMRVPSSISQWPLLVSTLLFHRNHLPDKKLSLAYFPLLINDQCPGVVMVLPSRWWPAELNARWLSKGSAIADSTPPAIHPAASSQRLCTNCRNPMRKLGLAAHYQRSVEIDVCEDCSLIWFDEAESARLAGPGIADLVRVIHTAMQQPRPMQAFPASLPCPICATALKRVANVSRFGRTAQLECGQKHGAFQSFSLFLAEKGYFRPFSWADIKKLMEAGKQPSCFNCGARLESRPHDECPYCRSPVGLLDAARLAKAIDIHSAAPALQLVPTIKQTSCPCCGGGIDLTTEMVCPHCMAVVRPIDSQSAMSANDAVDAHVRGNYESQTAAVSRVKLEDLGQFDNMDDKVPRGEGLRRGVIILLAILAGGYVVSKAVLQGPAITHYVEDADGKRIGYSAAEYNAQEAARRKADMAKVRHAPAGETPFELAVSRSGDHITVTNRTNRRLQVGVNLVYEQYENVWIRCELGNVNQGDAHDWNGIITLTKSDESKMLSTKSCKPKVLEKGLYEFTIEDMDTRRTIFKSDSAFF